MPAAATGEGGALSAAQVAEIRRFAERVAANGAAELLRDGAGAAARLAAEVERLRADGDGFAWEEPDAPEQGATRDELERWRGLGRRLAAEARTPEEAATARAIELLAVELESLREDLAPRRGGAAEQQAPAGGGTGPRSRLALAGAAAPALCLLVLAAALLLAAPGLDPRGPSERALLGRADLRSLELSIGGDPGLLDGARWTLDGEDVSALARRERGRLVLSPRRLADGEHEVEVRVGGPALWSSAAVSWRFTVDATPPAIRLPGDVLEGQARTPFVLTGEVEGAVSLVAGERPVPVRGGRFEVRYPEPPARPVRLVARDEAGNEAAATVAVVLVPRLPSSPLRGVHVTADAWANAELRAAVLRLVEEGRINTVELDLKDESGIVGWDAPVPLAREIGAVRERFDLGAAVRMLHERGVRVVGRLVAFRDPILAEAAWRAGRRAQVIQTPGRRPYSGGYGGFTNFASPAVRRYNIDIAVAAAALGVDDILYDYVRRPDGPLDTMRFPGLRGSAAASIVSFLAEAREALPPTTFLGASVFGIAVTRPDEVAQDLSAMAREVDYVAPMLYPSHWAPGEYGVANPNAQPYDIVLRSLGDYAAAVEGTGARVVPWLQDFSLGVDYGPAEVRAQIRAARDAGIREYLLWDPAVTYTARALDRGAPLPATGEAPARSGAPAHRLPPNEAGLVPVLMYHQILPDGGGEYDLTPAEFRRELDRLYREGYRPIRASDLAQGTIDVPRGTTPVVLTFDDAASNQAALLEDGRIDPATAAGILLEFARTHPGFGPAATFYVNRDPFSAGERTTELLQKLESLGFELGNHTRAHVNLGALSPAEVEEQIVLGNRLIREHLPQARIETLALPMGVPPRRPELALAGSWDGERYAFAGVLLVGAEPAPSPFTRAFDPGAIPRIRSTADRSLENGSADWLARLRANPELRFVSDGDPRRITVPRGREGDVAERFREWVRVR